LVLERLALTPKCRGSNTEMIFRLTGDCSAIVIAIVIVIVIPGVSLFLACCLQWLLFFIVIYNAIVLECTPRVRHENKGQFS
jgi:uncharacterized protein (DUF983 family)